MAAPHRIDVHHHPTPVLELMGGRVSGSPGIKGWTAALSLEDMDKNGVATAILSMPSRANVWRSGDQARNRAMARQWNEFMTRQGAEHPGRFGVFATVPIFDIEGSLREAEYALDVLKADGIVLMTNMGDKWLGDPHYFPLFEELNRRRAVIYTHPISADCLQNKLTPDIDDSVIEFTADTSRAIARLLFSGAAHRFPDIRFIFSHAGGTMPFILERYTRHAQSDPALAARVPDGVLAYVKRFYYDTAQASHPFALASITQFVAISQFLFGTDFPFRNAEDHVNGLKACGFAEADLFAIECGNAQRLLPRWAV
jgi:predicted TIM-barrel fold metal-dependent hydrolase